MKGRREGGGRLFAFVAGCVVLALGVGVACGGTPAAGGAVGAARAEIGGLIGRLERTPRDRRLLTRLAEAYVREAQLSGEALGYTMASAALAKVLAGDPADYGALALKGWAEYGQHRFREALASARKASAVAPDAAQNHALVSDCLLELGLYDEAVEALQQAMDRQPGPALYSRAAYLRYLHGDLPGALEMIEKGLESALSGGARDLAAWLYCQAGEVRVALGEAAAARACYDRAMAQIPGYFRAVSPLARLRASAGDAGGAATLLAEAAERHPDPAVLGDLEALEMSRGRAGQASVARARLAELAKADLARHGRVDRGLARVDLDRGRELERALQAAREDYSARPDIWSADLLAWALFKTGHVGEAEKRSAEALRLGTPDGLMEYHRGTILVAAGKRAEGEAMLAQALRRGAGLPIGGRAAMKNRGSRD